MELINQTQKTDKVLCPGCGRKKHYSTVGAWTLKSGGAVCFYGVCKDCANNPSPDMAQQCEARLLAKYPQIKQLLPEDEIRVIAARQN